MAGVFKYRFVERGENRPAVVKLWFGKKYFIWKCLKLNDSCDQIFRDLNRKVCKFDLPEDDLFFKVAKYCSRARITISSVEVLFQSDDMLLIRAVDKEKLKAAEGDDNCLNNSFDQYIPKWLLPTTSNKALQSTISPSASITTKQVPDVKPEPKKVATDQKLATVETTGFNPAQLLSKIRDAGA